MTVPGPGTARPGGPDGEGPGDRRLRIRRPADGTVVGEAPVLGPGEVERAVRRCRKVQEGWARFSPGDRARRMERLHRVIGDRADEIAGRVIDETGKPEVEALTEVVTVLDLLRFYLRVAPGALAPRKVSTGWLPGRRARVELEPFGVVGVISPWNYPFILAMDPVVTALVTGNGAVLKPSEVTPFTGLLVGELVEAAGLPEGLVRVVTGDGTTGDALVRSGVDRIVFTGSPATGRRVMAAAAETLTPVTLELGGKDPALVLEDADLDRAARGVVFGGFYNAGQTCIATERVFVVDAVYDRFLERLEKEVGSLRAASSGERDVGPLTTPAQLRLVEEQVSDAVEKGATVLVGGGRTDPAANVYRPTLVVDADETMRLLTEETFGPVLPVVRVRGEDEAVERANRCGFGLFASVWTGDPERGERVARRLRAGGVSVNDTLSHYAVPGLPMGGVGESGFGRSRGLEGLRELSRTRSLLVNRGRFGRSPWWFPYDESGRRLVRALLEYRRFGGIRGAFRAVAAWIRGTA